MRLQKQVNRRVQDKEYAKYVVIVPPEDVEKLGWTEGEELDHEVKDRTLMVRKAKSLQEEASKVAAKYIKNKRK